MTKQERKALNEFLLDIDCLSELSKWQDEFNIFEILKISRAEIRHSNILSWLMTPNENHGMGDNVLKGVFQYLAEIPSNIDASIKLMTMDNYSFSVRREWENIDILAVSDDEKCVVCIENKIDSKENKGSKDKKGQLENYKATIEENYPKYDHYFVFLTPSGEEPSDTENWTIMDYSTIYDIVLKARNSSALSKEAKMLIDNYISLLRRKIMKDDQELIGICNKIYLKHRQALDLIFENKTDQVVEACTKWLKSKNFEIIKSSNTVIAFETVEMEALFPTDNTRSDSGAWKNGRLYCFEIEPNRNNSKIIIRLVFDLYIKNNENKEKFIRVHKKKRSNNWYTAVSKTFNYVDGFSTDDWFNSFNKAWEKLEKSVETLCKQANLK
jgi:hypothetical protein